MMEQYRERLKDKKRIVVKIGSSSLQHPETGDLDYIKLEVLVRELCNLKNQGKDVVLVTSGAIAQGKKVMHLREEDINEHNRIAIKQACAAIGQSRLMMTYERIFSEYNQVTAQILMTKNTIVDDLNRYNAHNTFSQLLQMGVIPVVNENDTVAIDELELEMGENDSLAAVVATIANADLLIIMSDIDGLYDSDPRQNPDAKMIPVVREISEDIHAVAGGAGTKFGTGGMATKIHAVEIAYESDIDVVLMNGQHPKKLYELFEDKPVGTLFHKG